MVKPMAMMEIMPRGGMVGGGGEDVESERPLLAATGTSVLLRKKHGGAAAAAMTHDADTLLGPITKCVCVRYSILACFLVCHKLQSLPQPPLPFI